MNAQHHLDRVVLDVDRSEVLRYLGYPAGARPGQAIEESVRQAAHHVRANARPRGTYSLYGVESCGADLLTLSGGATFTGRAGEFLGQATRIAVFVATAGPEVVEMGDAAWRAGDLAGSLIYHAMGAALAEAAADQVVAALRLQSSAGETLTMRYSPGYCGISLEQQQTIFRLVDATRIGVELLPSFMMTPAKSVSGLIGIGPESRISACESSPCSRCDLEDCAMRR